MPRFAYSARDRAGQPVSAELEAPGRKDALRILAARGRKSGEWHTNVVNLLTHDGQRYLVAPRGNTQWSRNVRAAGGPHTIITDPKTGLMTAPDMAIGCGFMRLSRKAFVALWDNAADKHERVVHAILFK